jgi:DNA-directed RNA polymerase specialized sigma24 family protein
MARTLEELASDSIDGLYQGALFLSGGHEGDAEALLMDTMTLAFHECAGGAPTRQAVEHWLEARLVRSYLAHAPTHVEGYVTGDAGRQGVAKGSGLRELGPAQLFTAAGALPPWPRAALWLVLLRRWGYGEAARVLGIEVDRLRNLLRYRDALLRQVLRWSGGSDGTTGTMT